MNEMQSANINSFLYDMYMVNRTHEVLNCNMDDIHEMFSKFNKLLDAGNYSGSEEVLNEISEILGEDNKHVINSRTSLEFERVISCECNGETLSIKPITLLKMIENWNGGNKVLDGEMSDIINYMNSIENLEKTKIVLSIEEEF